MCLNLPLFEPPLSKPKSLSKVVAGLQTTIFVLPSLAAAMVIVVPVVSKYDTSAIGTNNLAVQVIFPVNSVAPNLVTVRVSVEKVKSASSVNLPLVVANGILPAVKLVPLSNIMPFLAAPVVIVKYKLSVVNSIAPTSATVIEFPDVNFRGAVDATAVHAANSKYAVAAICIVDNVDIFKPVVFKLVEIFVPFIPMIL